MGGRFLFGTQEPKLDSFPRVAHLRFSFQGFHLGMGQN